MTGTESGRSPDSGGAGPVPGGPVPGGPVPAGPVPAGPDRVIVEADGGARGNPGPAGYGALLRDPASGAVLAERSGFLGVTTNNVAEYSGLIAGLQAAVEAGARAVDVQMDSKLVIEQMSGRWQIKHPGLRPLAARAAALVRRFDEVGFTWVPRSRNAAADALANAAMDRGAAGAAGTSGPGDGGAGAPGSRGAGVGSRNGGAGVGSRDGGVGTGSRTGGRAAADPLAAPAPSPAGKVSWEPPDGPATRLLLVRHGETELTAQRRYSGRGDVPLSPRGREQARAVAARIARVGGVAAVVSSPLARCTGTAGAIAQASGGLPVTVEPDLIECDFGDWEGRTFAEIRAGWPAELAAWLGSTEAAPPAGESLAEVAVRVHRAAVALRERYAGRTVVVVAHVSPIKLLLRDALGAGDQFLHRLYLDPTGLSIMDYWASGQVAVRTVNEAGHLS